MTCPAVVLLIFNRPAETFRVFERIREARPEKLLVVADGPRASRSGEAERCRETRAVIERVDWPCQVLTNFADTNMGCGRRVASGLDWAFEQVEEAVILEDDCLADPTFFPFCGELLERYRADERVMMISGDNFLNGAKPTPDSYYFSQLPHCWGWATWRRAWRHCDLTMREWREKRDMRPIRAAARHPVLERRWQQYFDEVATGRGDIWDFQWLHCMLVREGLSIAPAVNLVTNIGFGETATHTLTVDSHGAVPSHPMEFPLRHPAKIEPCEEADEAEKEHLYRLSRLTLIDHLYLRLRPIVTLMRPFLERTGVWVRLYRMAARLRAS